MINRKLKTSKKALALMMTFAMTMSGIGPVMSVNAVSSDSQPKDYSDEGYKLVWHDEFDGDELNLEDWNVEAHQPGWVNKELQRYVGEEDMEDNIEVSDGMLSIYPTAEKKNKPKPSQKGVDVFEGNSFDSSWGGSASAVVSDGKATIDITEVGENAWEPQYQKAGMTLIEGHNYKFTLKA
ncbi:MAG: hypothetical protein K6F55_08260, partial [Eubacterium sp.]|nr:hypothetical protein [Eubacterium sp.]